jgi:lipopolysaccharide export system protein LptA
MKKTFLLSVSFLFLFNSISAEEDTISALSATYEDSNLMLEGEVKLLHGLGTLQAEKASLFKQENDKNLPFSSIHLEDGVNILCKNQATLNCDLAKLDFVTLRGEISALESNRVTYSTNSLDSKEGTPFQIQSQAIDVTFSEHSKESDTEYLCDTLRAKRNVTIQYATDFVLKTDEAHYKRTSTDSSLSGIVTAYPTAQDSTCHLCYQNENIETSFIEITMEDSLIHLKDPKGSLPSSLFSSKQKGQLFFSCKDLNWDHLKGVLTLKQEIQVQESHFGCLSAAQTLTIEQNKTNNDTFINSLHAEGLSSLTHNDSTLTSYGSLHVDGIKGQITVLSPKIEGKVSPQDQVLYQNNDMQLQADTALLEYTEPLHELSSLTFHGSIRIQSLDAARTARCALADRLVYAPDTKTVILSAHTGKKVLFWDEEQGATLSAKEVHLTQNPLTGKTEIKGIGNMKLSLSPEEQKQLKKHFPKFPTSEDVHATN